MYGVPEFTYTELNDMMTPTAIKWLLYDVLRDCPFQASTTDEVVAELQKRGATYEDLVAFIVESK